METKEEEIKEIVTVTDKELLVFCNLVNLKMEHINLLNEKAETVDDITKIITTNHTIYSLLHGAKFIEAVKGKDFSGYMEKLKGKVFIDGYTNVKGEA